MGSLSHEPVEVRVARLEERVDQIVGDISILAKKIDSMASKEDLADLQNYFKAMDEERKKDLSELKEYLEQRDAEREKRFRELDAHHSSQLFWIIKALLFLVGIGLLVSLGVPNVMELISGWL